METMTRLVAPRATAHVVHVIDDDEAVRRSLALLLVSSGHTVETYPSAEAFLAAIERVKPGCVIVDIRMPDMDGLELQEELRRRDFTNPVIVVTGHGEIALATRAMKAGAIDFIEKPYSDDDLLGAVSSGLARLEDSRHARQQADLAKGRVSALTPRERDVLRHLVSGRPNKVIAHELGISPRTVEIHRANMMEKLSCRSLAEAVRLALTAGFVTG
jgi:two-component system response regulator FixJ